MAVNTAQYESGRRDVNKQHGAQSAANEFGRFTSQQRFSRQLGDYKRDFGRGQSAFMGNQASRGMTGGGIQSGGFQQALSRRAGDYAQNLGRMNLDASQDNQKYSMNQANLDQWRTDSLADIENAKTNEIAMTALNIQALKPLFGG